MKSIKLGCTPSVSSSYKLRSGDEKNVQKVGTNMSLYVPKPAEAPPSTGSATGNPRNKVALKPGRSLMDWIRLGKSGKDLTGIKGQRMQVTTEELAKHNKQDDAWMAIRGYVYNVTPYMEYHPGGIPELVRGIGKDATELFDEAHKWVNFQSMLSCCLVGKLVNKPVNNRLQQLRKHSDASLVSSKSQSDKGSTTSLGGLSLPAPSGQPKPKYDWLQTDDSITVIIYTKCQQFRHEDLIIDTPECNELKVTVLINDHTYCLHLELCKEFKTDYKVRVRPETGKAEISFSKGSQGINWPSLGTPRGSHDTWSKTSELDVVYRQCQLTSVDQVNHDTNLYKITLPQGTRMIVALGYHVRLKAQIEDMEVVRCYTVVPPSIGTNIKEDNIIGRTIYFLIKIYQGGTMTQYINNLKIGDYIAVSNPEGSFTVSSVHQCTHVTLCAAGTGFTPMVGLLQYMLYDKPEPDRKVSLLFYNKTEKDIVWREKLDELEANFSNFTCHHILSQAGDEWNGLRGRINKSHLDELIPRPDNNNKVYLCFCGPVQFTKEGIRLAEDIGYSKDMIHAFLG